MSNQLGNLQDQLERALVIAHNWQRELEASAALKPGLRDEIKSFLLGGPFPLSAIHNEQVASEAAALRQQLTIIQQVTTQLRQLPGGQQAIDKAQEWANKKIAGQC